MKRKSIFKRKFFDLTGAIHNHTKYSYDSEAEISQILKDATKAELDYLTINDHMNMDACNDPAVASGENTILIIGSEINDRSNNNHFLIFNHETILDDGIAGSYTEKYYKNGSICFVAHPFETRKSDKFRKYLWTDQSNHNFHGLEIWNVLSEWIGKLNPSRNGFFLINFPSLFIKKANRSAINYWDELVKSGERKSAIGSIDAHTIKHKWMIFTLTFLTHKYLFRTVRTNILLEDDKKIDKNSILTALKEGNSYIFNLKMGNPYNFYAGICDDKGKGVIFGEEIEWRKNLKFYFRLPKIAKVVLYRSGEKIGMKRDEKGEFNIPGKGNYRLEISRFGRDWILTNNIYVV